MAARHEGARCVATRQMRTSVCAPAAAEVAATLHAAWLNRRVDEVRPS